jgi:hypothetical protein
MDLKKRRFFPTLFFLPAGSAARQKCHTRPAAARKDHLKAGIAVRFHHNGHAESSQFPGRSIASGATFN